ncbi:sterol desaturase/sphingolipid hydroxylase (fatty acid hydroxylase superfamily) [Hamadaea flava]|uniref:Cardiolipin synthase N-terminal domain-containing protein n=1 Tax=Hamadaea flava TaxID=1742688 RepID=A0ABV8M104_9ACTN|nr:hypothetical protein [Hamadaea flava]MCP2321983.1 sterol desaturase/sphingolipid hydroxylase (fatty acid hydroxylase superfamily) [Hamadaea flava]
MIRLGPLVQSVLVFLLIAPLIVFWAWMLDDMLQNPLLTRNARTAWLAAFLGFTVFGAGVYFLSLYRGPGSGPRNRRRIR